MSATFRFGAGDVHEFRVECDLLGGERYFVDQVLLAKRWSLSAGGSREFDANGHRIRIVLRASPKEVISEAYVDGQLKVKELFPELTRLRNGPGREPGEESRTRIEYEAGTRRRSRSLPRSNRAADSKNDQ